VVISAPFLRRTFVLCFLNPNRLQSALVYVLPVELLSRSSNYSFLDIQPAGCPHASDQIVVRSREASFFFHIDTRLFFLPPSGTTRPFLFRSESFLSSRILGPISFFILSCCVFFSFHSKRDLKSLGGQVLVWAMGDGRPRIWFHHTRLLSDSTNLFGPFPTLRGIDRSPSF